MPNQKHPHISLETQAYYAGRNSWFPGEAIPSAVSVDYRDYPALAASWKRGLRSVLAEERLNADTDWDGEVGW